MATNGKNDQRSYIYLGLAGETGRGREVHSGLLRLPDGSDEWQPIQVRARVAKRLPLPVFHVHTDRSCPNCGSRQISKSHRRSFYERYLLALFRVRPYRCDSCDERFYRRSESDAASSAKAA